VQLQPASAHCDPKLATFGIAVWILIPAKGWSLPVEKAKSPESFGRFR
jgi:hypothetical protein